MTTSRPIRRQRFTACSSTPGAAAATKTTSTPQAPGGLEDRLHRVFSRRIEGDIGPAAERQVSLGRARVRDDGPSRRGRVRGEEGHHSDRPHAEDRDRFAHPEVGPAHGVQPDAEGLQHGGLLEGHPGRHGVAHALRGHDVFRECADPFPDADEPLLGALVVVALPAVDAAAASHVRLQRDAVSYPALGDAPARARRPPPPTRGP